MNQASVLLYIQGSVRSSCISSRTNQSFGFRLGTLTAYKYIVFLAFQQCGNSIAKTRETLGPLVTSPAFYLSFFVIQQKHFNPLMPQWPVLYWDIFHTLKIMLYKRLKESIITQFAHGIFKKSLLGAVNSSFCVLRFLY